MTMSIGTLSSAMKSAIITAIAPWTTPSRDDHRLTGLTADAYWTAVTTAIATTVINHITSNAKATGTDSRGDTHTLDIA